MSVTGYFNSAAVLLVLSLALTACTPTGNWRDSHLTHYRERLQTRTEDNLRVSMSVLSADESQAVYGVPLARKGIQPIWIEVENQEEEAYWLLPLGLDPSFFPDSEAADAFAGDDVRGDQALRQRFQRLAFRNPIPAGATVSGFVLSNLDEGVKMVEIDLVKSGQLRTFSFLADVPGFYADYVDKDEQLSTVITPGTIINYTDDESFRAALEDLPCCVTNKQGMRFGDPLNLVIIGGREDAFPALVRRGWHPTEATHFGSVMKMINSVLSGERYRYAPISPQYLYGRPQDFAMQKARDTVHQRNHLRLWLSPIQYHGKSVWVGQISRDIGSRLTIHSPYLTTHKIDPDVDEALLALIQDLAYSQFLASVGLVKGVGAAPRDAPRTNLTTDPYFTAGYRGVLIFDQQPRSLSSIDFLPWEQISIDSIDPGHSETQP